MHHAKHTPSIDALQKLLSVCSDGIAGYRHAASAVTEPEAHEFAAQAAAEREEIASVLTVALRALGVHPDHHGSAMGAAHRAWLDAIATLDPGSTPSILRECERGEKETVASFQHVLELGLPKGTREVIQSQLDRIHERRSSLARMRDALGA
jgi:uncharacterized protein (TIGR02284 family)